MVDSFFNSLPEYIELIMGFAPALIAIAIPIAVFIAYRKAQNAARTAKETAEQLGLKYINVTEEEKDDHPETAFLANLLAAWSPWAMEGTYNDAHVRVELILKTSRQRHMDSSNFSNPTRTSYSKGVLYSVPFKDPLPFTIGISRAINMPFGLEPNTMETGDEELDRTLSVSGSDKDKIQEWLNSGRRKETLIKKYEELPSLIVNNDGLQLKDQNSRADYNRIRNNLTLLIEMVLKLESE